ncbi:family 78 glycoside hydrolase catalytic domain [Pedobacter sp. GR22-6]
MCPAPVRLLSLILLSFFFPGLLQLEAQEVKIGNLQTEYCTTPLGIDVLQPRFSWQMHTTARGYYQSAYQILVRDEEGLSVWNSGKINQKTALNILYSGKRLKPRTRYQWQLSVWDQQHKKHLASSWFETGLMDPNPNAAGWGGAKWIGADDKHLALYSHYLPVFKLSFSLQLDENSGSTKAGFIYGANDLRLMDSNKNLFKLANPKDSAYIMIELDLSGKQPNAQATLNVYRRGYAPEDRKEKPLKTFLIPSSIINPSTKYHNHRIHLSSNLGDTHIYMDGLEKENLLGRLNLNPLGQGGDFIAFPVLGDVGYKVPYGQKASFSDLEIRNYRSPSNVLVSTWNKYSGTTSAISAENKGYMVISNPSQNAMPMLRTTFTAKPAIRKARLYVTSRGIYEVRINGKRIGEDYLNPGLTQYNKTHLYQSYDVTKDLSAGENAIAAILAEGWWSGGATYMGEFWNFFGDRQSLLAKLVIQYENGQEESIVTDPLTWKYSTEGPLRYGSLFQGEVYDARREAEVKGWDQAGYDATHWLKTVEVPLVGNISLDESNKGANMPMTGDFSKLSLIGQYGAPVRKIKAINAKSMEEVRPGVYVYDMGQNMAGVPKVMLSGLKPGKRVILRFAEVKYPDLPEYKDNKGMIMLENIRAAMAQEIYIAKGGTETINPRFTYHGYRFVEITGLTSPPALSAVSGEVLSSVTELDSKYESSSEAVNKLWENITWSTFANFMSIPTDCPQRNERLGWSGDISVFAKTATYLSNVPQFLRRHMQAMRDTQREDGRFSDVAPLGGGFGGVLWGSAGITVAWESYQQYGDRDLLVEHYAAMKKYVDYLSSEIDPKTGVLDDKNRAEWSSLGDWLSPEYNKTEKALLWDAYYIYNLELMAKIAGILAKPGDAASFQHLAAKRKVIFNDTYIDPLTKQTAFRGKIIDTQSSYVIPLQFTLLNEANAAAASLHLVKAVQREHVADDGSICPPYSLMTGFIGTAGINPVLSAYGQSEVAYRLLQQRSYPSWLYSVSQGATTIWERLNSYTQSSGFGGNNRMNSFNHYSFGAVGSWLYEYSLGIQRDEASPGFQHFILRPEPDPTGGMTYAKGFYNSMYGKIESSWEIRNKSIRYEFVVPANSSATLYLIPGKSGNPEFEKTNHPKGVVYSGMQNGKHCFKLSSGTHTFNFPI